jgi:hypothetical protein
MSPSIRTYLRCPHPLGTYESAHKTALLRRFTHVLRCRRPFSAPSRRNIRLINVNTLSLEEFHKKPPEYAILSHTWGDSEVSFQGWQRNERNEPETQEKQGYEKIGGACAKAAKLGYEYLWCDTNCIDKTSSAELSEAINSMFAWYKNSAVCFAYLADVPPFSPQLVASLNSQNHQSLAQKYERMVAKILFSSQYPTSKPPSMEISTSDSSTTSSLAHSYTLRALSPGTQALERTQYYQKRAQQYERMSGEIHDVLGLQHPKLRPPLMKSSNSDLNTTSSLIYSNARAAFPSDIEALKRSRWFTRGWTLQELLAPQKLIFFANDWSLIGLKQALSSVLSDITGIDEGCIKGEKAMAKFSISQRMAWASKRSTTRIEDVAYSLLGIFDINMPLLYGEGPKAFKRLQEEIIRVSSDQSILAWAALPEPNSYDSAADIIPYLASHPREFDATLNPSVLTTRLETERSGGWTSLPGAPFAITNVGLSIQLPLLRTFDPNLVFAGLNYVLRSDTRYQIWLPLVPVGAGNNHFQRIKFSRSGLIFPMIKEAHQNLESIFITDDASEANTTDLIDLPGSVIPKLSYMITYGNSHPSHYISAVAASHGCSWIDQYSLLMTGKTRDPPGQREYAVLVFNPIIINHAGTGAFALVLWTTHKLRGMFSDVGGIVVTNLPPPFEGLAHFIGQEVEESHSHLAESVSNSVEMPNIPIQSFQQIQAQNRLAHHRLDQGPCDTYPRVTLGQQVKWGRKMRIFHPQNQVYGYVEEEEILLSDWHDEANQCLIPVRIDFTEAKEEVCYDPDEISLPLDHHQISKPQV